MKSSEFHAERRSQILEAVCRILKSKSFLTVTIRDVAAEVGLSYGMVHYYFADKDELLYETAVYLSDRIERVIAEEYRRLGDGPFTKEDVKRYFTTLIDDIFYSNEAIYIQIWYDICCSCRFNQKICDRLAERPYRIIPADSPLITTPPSTLTAEQISSIISSYYEGICTMIVLQRKKREEVIADTETLIDRLFC